MTRYFGGVKLGTGGLGRAYAGVVVRALETLPTITCIEWIQLRIEVPFPSADALFRALDAVGAVDRDATRGSGVTVHARVPGAALSDLRDTVARLTAGTGRVEIVEA